jgi:hypothetical protein
VRARPGGAPDRPEHRRVALAQARRGSRPVLQASVPSGWARAAQGGEQKLRRRYSATPSVARRAKGSPQVQQVLLMPRV